MDIKPTAIDLQTSMMLGQSNNKSKEDLKQVAEQFEAIFVDMYLKEARKAELADTLFQIRLLIPFSQCWIKNIPSLCHKKLGWVLPRRFISNLKIM